MYEVLFQPMKIGGMSLKNRIAMAPMATVADPDGGFSLLYCPGQGGSRPNHERRSGRDGPIWYPCQRLDWKSNAHRPSDSGG